MRKQRLDIWLVCAAAGLEGSSNPASTSFHHGPVVWESAQEHQGSGCPGRGVLQARGLLTWKLLVGEGFAGRGLSRAEACRWETAWCVPGTRNSAGLLKHEVQGPWEVGDAGEAGGGLGKSNSQSF